MKLKVKRKNLFLIDDISPYKNFINARKTLRNVYLQTKKSETPIKPKILINRNRNKNNKIYNNIRIKTHKIPNATSFSERLLKEQKFLISHFLKESESKNDIHLYDSNSNSLLKTLDRINYDKYKNNRNNKINMIQKYSEKNIFKSFKTLPNESIKNDCKSVKKERIKYDKVNLPMINYIYRKKAKLKNIL